jgi:hypothetical protein
MKKTDVRERTDAELAARVKLTMLGTLIAELLEFHPPLIPDSRTCPVCQRTGRLCPAMRMRALLVDLNWRPS